MRPAALLLLALAASGARGSSAAAFASRADLITAVTNCVAKVPSGFECCSRAVDPADCGVAGTTDVPGWNTVGLTSMQSVFQYKYSFNQDIGAWDTSAVTNMQQMFYDARAFNQDIGSWDVSSLLVARYLFSHARAFNQDISMWDVSAATDFHEIFTGAISFVQDISGWVMKDASVIVTLMFNNPCSASVPCNAWHTTFTNCGHPASAIPSICTSGPYAPSSAQYSGPPGAWQINVPVVIIPPPIIAAIK